jgi:hypothetical protein
MHLITLPLNNRPLINKLVSSIFTRSGIVAFLLACFLSGGCFSKGESSLSKALSGAVKEKRISARKMENILAEYDKLRDEDKKVAHDYVNVVLTAIEMGGDSSHIDAARKQVLQRVNPKAKV